MAGTKEIKRRIKSVKNTKKITKAMELVAASKMKRAVANALSSRLYASYSWDVLSSLSTRLEEVSHPFFNDNGGERDLVVLITSNRGLCGAYNSQVIKKTIRMLKAEISPRSDLGKGVDLVTVGKKGDVAMRRTNQNIIATFLDLSENVSLRDVSPVSTMITSEYKKGSYGKIYVAYTDFVSALSQKPNIRQLLPISRAELKIAIEEVGEERNKETLVETDVPYTVEGDQAMLIESLAEKLVRMQIYQMILESQASEQSSRMMAMKNASEAAGEMIDDLTLAFNKARQAGITREISEISAGMASVS
ncbi:MAG: ATP synthase F1 subunit gamma [Candidatus Nomurabacteria bacterium]|nr:ATP synthase F1 subunit gamma [Candidatus Nomurabacteria bacterium]